MFGFWIRYIILAIKAQLSHRSDPQWLQDYVLRSQRNERKERNGTNVRNVRNITKWRYCWIGQSQPSATTVYAAGTLPSCGRHAVKYKIIEINFICIMNCTTSKKRTKIWTIDFFFKFLCLKNFSWAGKKTARFLLAGACDSCVPYDPYVLYVSSAPYVSSVTFLTFVALAGNPASVGDQLAHVYKGDLGLIIASENATEALNTGWAKKWCPFQPYVDIVPYKLQIAGYLCCLNNFTICY